MTWPRTAKWKPRRRGACLRELVTTDHCLVDGQPELLRRAVENVVRNAIRHAPKGTSVELGLKLVGDTATISVRDHGPGVPDDSLGAIFEPFVRVEGDRSRISGGVGLGLAIARRAVELHRGRITAQNARPGLLVRIELPGAVELSAEAALAPTGGEVSPGD
jgi:signal transduction histidine kinase